MKESKEVGNGLSHGFAREISVAIVGDVYMGPLLLVAFQRWHRNYFLMLAYSQPWLKMDHTCLKSMRRH